MASDSSFIDRHGAGRRAEAQATLDDAQAILILRLLIARAANNDSLAWWDDESFAGHSAYLFERVFPVAPPLAARSLALRAAHARHEAAYAHEPAALHLFRLDARNGDKLALRDVALDELAVPPVPIRTLDELRAHLLRLTQEPKPYRRLRSTGSRALLIEVPAAPPGITAWRHRAQTLAWAYLEGAPNQPVFPYLVE